MPWLHITPTNVWPKTFFIVHGFFFIFIFSVYIFIACRHFWCTETNWHRNSGMALIFRHRQTIKRKCVRSAASFSYGHPHTHTHAIQTERNDINIQFYANNRRSGGELLCPCVGVCMLCTNIDAVHDNFLSHYCISIDYGFVLSNAFIVVGGGGNGSFFLWECWINHFQLSEIDK